MESTRTGVYSPRSRCTLWSGTAPPQFFVSHVQKSRCSGRFVCSKLDYTRCCNLPHQISGGNQLTVGIPLELQLPVRQEATGTRETEDNVIIMIYREKRAWYTLLALAQFPQNFGNFQKICSVALTSTRNADLCERCLPLTTLCGWWWESNVKMKAHCFSPILEDEAKCWKYIMTFEYISSSYVLVQCSD